MTYLIVKNGQILIFQLSFNIFLPIFRYIVFFIDKRRTSHFCSTKLGISDPTGVARVSFFTHGLDQHLPHELADAGACFIFYP
jgi:hypothetical protein